MAATASEATPTQKLAARGRHRRSRWRLPMFPTLIAFVCMVGVAILSFPYVAAWISQYYQSQLITEYSSTVDHLGPGPRRDALREAELYNATLTGGASVAANERIPVAVGDVVVGEYESLLHADDNGLMARIKIPAISVDLPVYHGTSDAVLDKGVGHLEGTALPVGGAGTHSVLTGHRGLATAELFTHLDQLVIGDTFTIEVFGEVLSYEVRSTRVVQPNETETLFPRIGEDLVTLVTCTPLGINSHRILITGERITPTPVEDIESAGKRPDVPGFPWWAVVLGVTLFGLIGYVYVSGRPPKVANPGAGPGNSELPADSVVGSDAPGAVERPDASLDD